MLLTDKTAEDQQKLLASFLPNGRAFLAKALPQTKLFNLLYGLAVECARVEGLLNDIEINHDINQTVLLIEEWESALGIPDDCIPVASTIEQRRANVIMKLGAMGLQTEQDWLDFITSLGYSAVIRTGRCYGIFPYTCTFPLYFFKQPSDARFDWEIQITGTDTPCIFPFYGLFPICFSSGVSNMLLCLFMKLKPRNTNLRVVFT
ncbi:MAG: DUF2313 domain-containing protein [Chitinophagaceae bacterium]|jgi:uncharacterized protein YmfQ (DUF2313 family)|nr:DUF2313 domain-containing protein [Chitinophagaceae bacterium]